LPILKVLDGQECRLDSKYSLKKKRNVPVANNLPETMSKHGPFRARVRFVTNLAKLEEEQPCMVKSLQEILFLGAP
jgi:hypothetical protein